MIGFGDRALQRVAGALAFCCLTAGTARADYAGGIGVLGDSYSDEYQFQPPNESTARNFVEILAATRGDNFGPFSAADLGSPRLQGYAFNWALAGATSSDLIAQGQDVGLASQIAGGSVTLGTLLIGINDFGFYLTNFQNPPPIATVLANVEANIDAAAARVLAASPSFDLVIFTVPDVSALPLIQGFIANGTVPASRATDTTAAIQALNAHIQSLAAGNPRIAVADLYGLFANLQASPQYPIDGITLDTVNPSNRYDHLFLADGYHPGTVGQGLMANLFANAADAKFNAGLRPLSDSEIVAFAQSVPEPSGILLLGLGGLMALAGAARRSPRRA